MTSSAGESEDSPHFWGDAAQQHIRYVRNLTFRDLDTLAIDPRMPYHDPRKPFVRCWFSSSDGHTVEHFNNLIRPENVDRLEAGEGVSIVYTHFTDGFVRNGAVDPTFAERMRYLAGKAAWFAPASDVLDRLSELRGTEEVRQSHLRRLELRWFGQRVANYIRYRR